MAAKGPVVITERRLSPAQAATRARLVEAAIALASEGGYEAVGVREAAKRAGLSVATGYQHFFSKDDVLLAVFRALLERGAASASRRPPADLGQRLVAEFRRVSHEVASRPLLYRAVFAAQASAAGTGSSWDEPWTSWFFVLWDSAAQPLPESAFDLLLSVLTGALVNVVSGFMGPAQATETFARAVDLAL